MTDIIRVLRVVEYIGERQEVEDCIAISLHGEKRLRGLVIKASTVGVTSEILDQDSPMIPQPQQERCK